MTNKISKKYGVQLGSWFNLGVSTDIETHENLDSIEKFIQNTGISNFLQSFRKTNTEKIFSDTQKSIKGEDIYTIGTKESINFLENASKEDDEYLQKKWSDLLANSLTKKRDVKNSYIEILKELSSIEVKILDKVYDEGKKSKDNIIDIQFSTNKIGEIFQINIEEGRLIVDNLFRLRLAEAPAVQGIKVGQFFPVGKTNDIFQLTTLGYKFIEACKFNK